jgi:hypothetical protein
MSAPSILFVLVAAVAAIPAVVAFIYRVWVVPVVAFHFGEDFPSRRNCAARQRRRTFGRLCSQAATCIYAASLLGGLKEALAALTPDYAMPIVAFQIILVAVALLFGWTAATRWRKPFED